MRILEDLYVYPWMSFTENNCNTVFIDGKIPVLVDPGHKHLFNHVIEGMANDGKVVDSVKLIILTHGHPDHSEAADLFGDDVIKAISFDEFEYISREGKELFLASGSQLPKNNWKIFLKEGKLKIGEKTFRIISTPGHSPGSICIYWEEKRLLISGDTVFYMGVGRFDLPGGDEGLLKESIRKLSKLDVEYLIPGHGEILAGAKVIKKNFRIILEEFF
ncbi:MAG: MBL fold metallo-hydrolase [Desulfobacterota bacterium]|nr:MBL fold metallo-hydrolase [Thermodesulfobacteriota bacterium]MDW8002133.1 MBL fold metallo-hydrolase [Deltaproteobacteria bacterium]